MSQKLTITNHDRDAAGFTYVYPVISRRAGGVSIGINLNPNNACNWHCAYCQVPELKRGVAPLIDLQQLQSELHLMLGDILHGRFMDERVPEECRKLCDVAISGNGEPTSCSQFEQVVSLIVTVMQHYALNIPLRLISNGSYLHKAHIRQGLALMAEHQGEVWFKIDAVTEPAIARINGVNMDAGRIRQQLELAAAACPTWIQSCFFAWDGQHPEEAEVKAYLDFLSSISSCGVKLKGVLLYGLARPSLQSESAHVSRLDDEWMQQLADQLRKRGFEVKLSL